jgi:hypothetical protein
MQRLIIGIVVLLAFSATGLYAHGPDGGGHGSTIKITEIQAREKATQLVATIVKKGQLDASWSQIQPSEAEKKTFQGRLEWVVTFVNPAEKDAAKQKLYVFLSLYGDYTGANYEGK